MTLRVEREGDIVCFTIDRPEARNALDLATMRALAHALETTPMRAAILTGGGEVFVSGGDLRELRGRDSAEDAAELTDVGFALTTTIAKAGLPVIAALNGPAIGGGAELALACDFRIARRGETRSIIELRQVHMGVTTSWGTAARLRELVGSSLATRLMFGLRLERLDDLVDKGLVDVLAEDPRAAAFEMARELVKAPPSALAAMKRLTRTSGDVRMLERELFVETWSGDEHRAAVAAWFAKRPPK